LQFGELVFVDHELGTALGTDDSVATIAARLAPFHDVPVGVAVALAEMSEDPLNRGTEREDGIGDAGRTWLHGDLYFSCGVRKRPGRSNIIAIFTISVNTLRQSANGKGD
jgi:hypothetical protein